MTDTTITVGDGRCVLDATETALTISVVAT